MFDYCGEFDANLDDYQSLLQIVIKEKFPTATFTVKIRQTKAMMRPLISISISDGPTPDDLVKALPMLAEFDRGTRWAHCGKILPRLDYSVRVKPNSPQCARGQEVGAELDREFGDSRFIELSKGRLRWNPALIRRLENRLAAIGQELHPAQPSPTLSQCERGDEADIQQIAVEQRQADLERATPQVRTGNAGQPIAPRRNRL